MQAIDFVKTIDWIQEQFSAETKEILFNTRLNDRIENDFDFHVLIRAAHDLTARQEAIENHPFAKRILSAFDLDLIADSQFPLQVTEIAFDISKQKSEQKGSMLPDNLVWRRAAGYQLELAWDKMLASRLAVEKLLIPVKVAQETDFDEILTLEWKYPNEDLPVLENIISTLQSANRLYKNLAEAHGIREPEPLSVLYLTSGSNLGIHLQGLGEPIKHLKNLLLEGYEALRRRKFDNATDKHKVVISMLHTVDQVQKMYQRNGLSPEDAQRLSSLLVKDTIKLIDNRVVPREVPDEEVISVMEALPPVPSPRMLPSHEGAGLVEGEVETEAEETKISDKPRQPRRQTALSQNKTNGQSSTSKRKATTPTKGRRQTPSEKKE